MTQRKSIVLQFDDGSLDGLEIKWPDGHAVPVAIAFGEDKTTESGALVDMSRLQYNHYVAWHCYTDVGPEEDGAVHIRLVQQYSHSPDHNPPMEAST